MLYTITHVTSSLYGYTIPVVSPVVWSVAIMLGGMVEGGQCFVEFSSVMVAAKKSRTRQKAPWLRKINQQLES